MSNSANFRRLSLYLLRAILLISVTGCIPVPSNSKYFRYEIELTANNRHYLFHQYFKCSEVAEFSEGDGKFHKHWRLSGSGISAADIGDNLVLFYAASGDCKSDSQQINSDANAFGEHAVKVLENSVNPERLYLVQASRNNSPISIQRQSVQRMEKFDGDLGPSKAQIALKESVRDQQHGFQRVTARIIPYEVWATSDRSRAYFSQFQSVTIAKVGEAPPVSGWPDAFVQFQFWRDRAYKKGPAGEITGLKEFELVYKGDAFEVPDRSPETGQVWYATTQTQTAHPNPNNAPGFAVVNYKGTLIKVKSLQEIFDPQTRNILLLMNQYLPYPWGGPDEVDLKRIIAGKH